MGIRQVIIGAAMGAAATISASALAQETATRMTTFFVAIPLDPRNAGEQVPNFGLQFQGARPGESVKIDYQMFRLLPALAGAAVKYVAASTRKSEQAQGLPER